MIQLILKSYFSILFAVSASCISIFLLGIFYIFKNNAHGTARKRTAVPDDITAIAGDDLFATQLDLARAFIESGKEPFARKILQHIIEEGAEVQQQEARTLLAQI